MAIKFYKTEKVINGKTYVAQFNGLNAALQAIDDSYIDDSGNTSMVKLSNYILNHVIIEPKGLTPDDFDSMAEFKEVIAFGREVMEGKFRPKTDESGDKKKG